MIRGIAFVLCMALLPVRAHAQVETVITPLTRAHSPQQLGARFRADANAATQAARQRDYAGARKHLAPVIAYCDQLATPTRDVVSVANAAEYDAFVAVSTSGKPVEWIDSACPSAYKMAAFVDIETRDHDAALAMLEKTSAVAPYWVEPHAERGYLLNQLGRVQEGLASYQRAWELVERYESNDYARALVLRGLGYTWIELRDLDRAEDYYRQSLQVEPGNAVAEHELRYIREQREGVKGAE
ncbi:MAG TPA: tetratricopeptide repeat protein [Lysobacter sp.]